MTYVPRLAMPMAQGFSMPLVSRLGNAVSFGLGPMPSLPVPDWGMLVNTTGRERHIDKECYPLSSEQAEAGESAYCLMKQKRYHRDLVIAGVVGAGVGALIVALIK
jgi:hypothetical protein